MSPLMIVAFAITALFARPIFSQSNYADQDNNVEYHPGLPEQTILDGKVTKLDDLGPVIFLNRTKAVLNCAAGSMQVELKFNQPFSGIVYANNDRNSPCKIYGKGSNSYRINLPLKGCGTVQGPTRVFTNNIYVRFHPTFEFEGDEIITIVCRYPPPVAPLPPVLPDYRKEVAPAPVLTPPLNSFQILLIICGILFLSLLLLGLGVSYYCLRRRPVRVFTHYPFSTIGSESDVSKISGSSLGNLSMFEGLKIPRAHAPLQAAASSSGSDGPLASDTLPSDYPSESHSEIEEIDARSLAVSSAGSFENKGYMPDIASIYSEEHEKQILTTTSTIPRAKEPKFDVQVRVNRPPPSPATLSISDTESSVSRLERNLSTILEKSESVQFTHIPEIHHPPRHVQPAPTFNRILKRQQEMQEMSETLSDRPTPPPPPPVIPKEIHLATSHKPEITSHMVDDIFLKTITEKKTIEDIERHKRLITEYHTRPAEIQQWDVTIKNYPVEREPPEWENFSDISSASGLTITNIPPVHVPPKSSIYDNKLPLNSPELVGSVKPSKHLGEILEALNVPLENPKIPNWNVLLRVFQPTESEGPVIENAETYNSQLTVADQMKWRQIITTESTLRTLLTEAVVREDYERIRRDARYETLFEPQKWDVIIRILAPNDKVKMRYKKKGEWDTRSRRSSLPTLYEYDSDDGSSVRTLIRDPIDYPPVGSRRQSRSSYRSEVDLRSMSEMTVDFRRPDLADNQSESSQYFSFRRYEDDSDSYYKSQHPSLARSLSQPSLARSASEFTEHWAAGSRYDTASEFDSPEGTPKSQRSSKILPLHIPRGSPERSSLWQGQSTSRMMGAQVITSEMAQQTTERVVTRQSRDWFRDNDSERL